MAITWLEKAKKGIVAVVTPSGSGTGFYFLEKFIATCAHVCESNNIVKIINVNQKEIKGNVVYGDENLDLAIIESDENFYTLTPGNIDRLKDGDDAIAIGHPLGLDYTINRGIISYVNRIQNGIKYIQTDTPINPGNSGGPLFNVTGEVIGINTFKLRGAEGLNFSLSINYLKNFAKKILNNEPILIDYNKICKVCKTPFEVQDIYCKICGIDLNKAGMISAISEETRISMSNNTRCKICNSSSKPINGFCSVCGHKIV